MHFSLEICFLSKKRRELQRSHKFRLSQIKYRENMELLFLMQNRKIFLIKFCFDYFNFGTKEKMLSLASTKGLSMAAFTIFIIVAL